MTDYLSAPSPPPSRPPPPPLLPPGYEEFRIEMTPAAIIATTLASFLGCCFVCVVGFKLSSTVIDRCVRKKISTSFSHSLRRV